MKSGIVMKFYWCARTRAFRIAWLLEELQRPYQRIAIDIRSEAARADATFRAASPMGKVPAIEDGSVRLWDSGAIAIYLADACPEAGLGVPIGKPERGAFLQWTAYTNAVMEPAMGEKFRGDSANTLQNGYGSYDLMLSTLVAGLSPGPWIMGARFSAADTLIGSGLHFMKIFGMLSDDQPELLAYVERCHQRPAFQRALAFENEA
ncbi:MAG: glutathione S-transferase family protein [Hyphomicrobiaceae bacterium]